MSKMIKWIVSVLGLMILFFIFPGVSRVLLENLDNLTAIKSTFSHNPDNKKATTILKEHSSENCRQSWLSIQLSLQEDHQTDYQTIMMACSDDYFDLVAIRQPFNIELARLATKQRPWDAESWLWLANARAAVHSPETLETYRQVVLLDPHNDLVWCHLGYTYELEKQIVQARDAYLQCCENGDQGSNGCYGAGRMEEMLGNPQKAIEYYRLSQWIGSLQRATELEKKLQP